MAFILAAREALPAAGGLAGSVVVDVPASISVLGGAVLPAAVVVVLVGLVVLGATVVLVVVDTIENGVDRRAAAGRAAAVVGLPALEPCEQALSTNITTRATAPIRP